MNKPKQSNEKEINNPLGRKIKEAEEMALIWDRNDDSVKMYLKGCITTAMALASSDKAG